MQLTTRLALVLALACAAPPAAAQCLDAFASPRSFVAGTAAGRRAYFAGGLLGADGTDRVDVLDLASGSWSSVRLSVPSFQLAAVTVGERAIFAGGTVPAFEFGMLRGTDVVDVWDAASGQHARERLALARWGLAATATGGLAIFAGGHRSSAPPFPMVDLVDVWDVAAGTWTTRTLSAPRGSLAATSVGAYALFAGGLCLTGGDCVGAQADVAGRSGRVDLWDVANDVWSTASLSQPRSHLAATSVGTVALFAGGIAVTGESARVDLWDSATGQWRTASLSRPRRDVTAFTVGGLAFFAGGVDDTGNASDVVDVYDPVADLWHVTSMAAARASFGLAVAGEQVVMAGGYGPGGALVAEVERWQGGVATVLAAGVGGCPCGNAGGADTGCANSTGQGAALALACSLPGVASARVAARGLVPSQAVLLLAATTSAPPAAFGDGLLALGGSLQRVAARVADGAGRASWPLATLGSGLLPGPWTAGAPRHAQAWYRDPGSPCGGGSNLTNALRALVWL